MQMLTLVSGQSTANSFTGSAVAYRPVVGFTSVFVAEAKRTSGSGAPASTAATIALQGSLDGTDWVTIDSFLVSAMVNSLGTTDWSSNGGYRSYVKVVQGFPLMRLVSSASVDTNVAITAYVANG